ncbi:MAG: hypothetical protein ABIP63_05355 [Thermoanaerobaculia bacterium]
MFVVTLLGADPDEIVGLDPDPDAATEPPVDPAVPATAKPIAPPPPVAPLVTTGVGAELIEELTVA